MFYVNEIIPGIVNSQVGPIYSKEKKEFMHLAVNVKAHVRVGHDKMARLYTAREQLEPFGNVEIFVGPKVHDFGGYRSDYINSNGHWEPDAYAKTIRTSRYVSRFDIDSINASLDYVEASEVGLLFNLLRQYYLLGIDYDDEMKDKDYYNDGHVAISIKDAFGFDGKASLTPVDEGFSQTGVKFHNSFRWQGIEAEECEIIAAALGKLEGTGGVGLAASSPALTKYAVFDSRVGSFDAWYKRDKVASLIKKLVTKYRMYNAFETALMLVVQISANFKAPIAEALSLRTAKKNLTLPEFSTFRFEMPDIANGNNGATRPGAIASYNSWRDSPNTIWIFSAVMNSAAEFRAVKSMGTDFDATEKIEEYMSSIGAHSGLAKWCCFASSATGKAIYSPETEVVGCDFSAIELKSPKLRKVGPTVGYRYRTHEDGTITLAELDDYLIQPYHSRLLFLIGVLPESKLGAIKRRERFDILIPRNPKRELASIKNKNLAAYLTMTRIFGYDVSVRLPDGSIVKNWADNGSRISWSSGDLEESPDSISRIISVEKRADWKNRRGPSPISNLKYDMELEVNNISTQYSYGEHVVGGTFPQSYQLADPGKPDGSAKTRVYEVMAPSIVSKTEDFGEARPSTAHLSPGEAEEDVALVEAEDPSLTINQPEIQEPEYVEDGEN
jgi:hypothetical protein